MIDLSYLFIFVAAVTLLMVLVALRWSRTAFARGLIVVLFLLLLPAAWAAPAELLGQAKPVDLEWLKTRVEEAPVLSATMVKGEAIYVALQCKVVPALYKLPWDPETAEQLQEAMREAERNGTETRMCLPFEPSWDNNEPRFYAPPQPKLPDKPGSPSIPEYEHPGQEI